MLNVNTKYLPLAGTAKDWEQTIFLKHFITKDYISVGDYTYYDASFTNQDPKDFENTNVLYFPVNNAKLIIGKFCMLANSCKFIMNGACHHLKPLTSYPLFWNFIDSCENYLDIIPGNEFHTKLIGDTVIGNDVWIGYDALILPGVRIGDGSIIGARSVVTKDVEPYSVVVGNPGVVVKKRFDDTIIEKLLKTQWWNHPMDKIMKNYDAIMNAKVDDLDF